MEFKKPYKGYEGKWLQTKSYTYCLIKYLSDDKWYVFWRAVILERGYYLKLHLRDVVGFRHPVRKVALSIKDESKRMYEPTQKDIRDIFKIIFITGKPATA